MRVLIMAMQMKCVSQIDAGQDGKNIGLDQGDAAFEDVDRNGKGKGDPPDQYAAADRQ